MPSAHRSLTPEDVRRFVAEQCFSTATGNVGAEVEWITLPAADPRAYASFETVREVVASLGLLPGASRVTYEPGGQIELSSAATPSAGETCERVAADFAVIREALEAHDVELAGIGLDPLRGDRRVIHLPRYAAMQAYFDSFGDDGRRMMCRTAAVQVNLDSGTGAAAADRWRRAHAIGPALAAAFANSPFAGGRPSGWRSTRLATWWAMDRTRTAPARADDPIDAWCAYALAARVMLIRAGDGWFDPVTSPLTFRRWMEEGHDFGFPTLEDLAYHTTTLFPPVRARGWLELRMIDALPDPWWRVAVAITAALLDDEEAAARASAACEGTTGMWVTASRFGLEHPSLARAAAACFTAALEALPRVGADRTTTVASHAFADRFTLRGRSPADDLLEEWASTGAVLPVTTEVEPAWT